MFVRCRVGVGTAGSGRFVVQQTIQQSGRNTVRRATTTTTTSSACKNTTAGMSYTDSSILLRWWWRSSSSSSSYSSFVGRRLGQNYHPATARRRRAMSTTTTTTIGRTIHRTGSSSRRGMTTTIGSGSSSSSKRSNIMFGLCRIGFGGGCLVGSYYYYYNNSTMMMMMMTATTTQCNDDERSSVVLEQNDDIDNDNTSMTLKQKEAVVVGSDDIEDTISTTAMIVVLRRLHRTIRIVVRCMKLLFVFTPVIALYPIYYYCCRSGATTSSSTTTNDTDQQQSPPPRDAHEIVLGMDNSTGSSDNGSSSTSTTMDPKQRFVQYYYTVGLYCVECSGGATIIKFLQWMSSRPDLFGADFCRIFQTLQDHTTPHHYRYTEQYMVEAYGTDWKDYITLHDVIGSGCIGQVYRGTVKVRSLPSSLDKDNDFNASDEPQEQQQLFQEVAIKVIHPNVRNDIDTDMDIIRTIISMIQYMNPTIKKQLQYLNIHGVLTQFQSLLTLQMDLRYEAKNLQRFNTNFQNDAVIQFPQLVSSSSSSSSSSSGAMSYNYHPTENVLIETYCDGIPILQYCRTHCSTIQQKQQLTKLCYHGIRAVCQMIFLDNFVHGDLHPGNVYISHDGTKFILFDVGIVNEYSYDDHTVLIDVLSAFIRKDGRKAGRRMIDDSNMKFIIAAAAHATSASGASSKKKLIADMALNEEQYIDKIELLTIKASTEGYFMEHLGAYISYICEAASTHHVMMNPSFVTAALAVKIQEGIALAMDPNCSIPEVAVPIIIESERRRYMKRYGTDTIKDKIHSTIDYFKRSVPYLKREGKE